MACKHIQRAGAALIVALVALAIAGAISMTMIRTAVLRREYLQLAQCRVQADWLVKGGIERAAARLAADPDYRGETWQPSLEDIRSMSRAAITIRVDDLQGQPAQRRIVVAARYEVAGKPVQRSRQVVIPTENMGAKP